MQITENTVAVVSGGASGLGGAVAQALAAAGAKVGIFDLNEETGTAMAAKIGGTFAKVDVAGLSPVSRSNFHSVYTLFVIKNLVRRKRKRIQ